MRFAQNPFLILNLLESLLLKQFLFLLQLTLSILLSLFDTLLLLPLGFLLISLLLFTLCFLMERLHPLKGELVQFFLSLFRVELRKILEHLISRIPNWTKVILTLFFDDNFLKYTLNGLFAAIGELLVEVIDYLLLRVE